MKKYFILFFFILSFCKVSSENNSIVISDFIYLYKKPEINHILKTSFPFDFVYPDSTLKYFIYLERTGIWTPDQYVLMLEINNKSIGEVLQFYKSILKIKDWQVLQSKNIQEKDKIVEFLNAQDYFNRNISILMENHKDKVQVKIYIKKLTDE